MLKLCAPSPERRNAEEIARAQSASERSGGALKPGDSGIVGRTLSGLLWGYRRSNLSPPRPNLCGVQTDQFIATTRTYGLSATSQNWPHYALRSSVVDSQHSIGLEPPVRQIDLWTL